MYGCGEFVCLLLNRHYLSSLCSCVGDECECTALFLVANKSGEKFGVFARH